MNTQNQQPVSNRKQITGLVVSTKMDKSIVVRADRRALHPLYRKYIVVSKKFVAHDADGKANLGDTVRIQEARPISKRKHWRLLSIVTPAAGIKE